MILDLLAYRTLSLRLENGILHLTLNRPEVRNAMNTQMVADVRDVLEAVAGDHTVRGLVLRGAGGHFCAGADLKDMAALAAMTGGSASEAALLEEYSRAFGRMIAAADAAPQTVIAILEGAVMGGGFGLACAADVAIAESGAIFAMPETTRGLPPAQIAPFVVRRIGLSQARRLALLGLRCDAAEALRLGIVHQTAAGADALQAAATAALASLRQCAPGANAVTKALLRAAADQPVEALVDRAAQAFASALAGPEGREGTSAFAERRPPAWAKA